MALIILRTRDHDRRTKPLVRHWEVESRIKIPDTPKLDYFTLFYILMLCHNISTRGKYQVLQRKKLPVKKISLRKPYVWMCTKCGKSVQSLLINLFTRSLVAMKVLYSCMRNSTSHSIKCLKAVLLIKIHFPKSPFFIILLKNYHHP